MLAVFVSFALRDVEPRWPLPKRLAKVSPAKDERRLRVEGEVTLFSSAIAVLSFFYAFRGAYLERKRVGTEKAAARGRWRGLARGQMQPTLDDSVSPFRYQLFLNQSGARMAR